MNIKIGRHTLGNGKRPYLVAELSGNHNKDLNRAKAMIQAAADSGADAVKLQTYTPDTLTLNSKKEYFKKDGSYWDGMYLYDLYEWGMTPWEWFPELKAEAERYKLDIFSTPFDESAVDFLEKEIDPPAYKIASFEVNYLQLLRKVAQTGKPVIMSTGMANMEEIDRSVNTLREAGCKELILLKCISAYPIDPRDFNLKEMASLRERYNCLVGLSDHTKTNEICLGAVGMGACFIEKHFTLRRPDKAIDDDFSLMPHEFARMATKVTILADALGSGEIKMADQEALERTQRRSIFVSKDVEAGEILNETNLRIVRPGHGICPSRWEEVVGKPATKAIEACEPLRDGDWATTATHETLKTQTSAVHS